MLKTQEELKRGLQASVLFKMGVVPSPVIPGEIHSNLATSERNKSTFQFQFKKSLAQNYDAFYNNCCLATT